MDKKVLIVGSNGMLGKDIVDVFLNSNQYELFAINRNFDCKLDKEHSFLCDITNSSEIKKILESINPNIIINCAANVSVDNCEIDKSKTYKLHVEATKTLSSFKSQITKYIYISTDSVFDGLVGNYKEDDKTNPLNYYAFTKLEGEKQSLKCNKNTLIIRTNIYGFHNKKSNSLAEWAIDSLSNKKSIGGFNDVLFNPVYTKQLAKIILKLINVNCCGTLNVSSNQYMSKYDFLIKLSNIFNLDSSLVSEISIDDINFNVKRPKNTTLNIEKLKRILNQELNLDDGLKEMYIDFLKNRRLEI